MMKTYAEAVSRIGNKDYSIMVAPFNDGSVTMETDLGGFKTCSSRKYIRQGKVT